MARPKQKPDIEVKLHRQEAFYTVSDKNGKSIKLHVLYDKSNQPDGFVSIHDNKNREYFKFIDSKEQMVKDVFNLILHAQKFGEEIRKELVDEGEKECLKI